MSAYGLYPHVGDNNFAGELATRQEFYDTRYQAPTAPGGATGIAEVAEGECERSRQRFEPAPHQTFVRNFLSTHSPYRGLLLYHGLGTGKTCSAIGVAEDMRAYLDDTSADNKRIFVVAAPNVQANFRSQLFEESRLRKAGGRWTLGGCAGDTMMESADVNADGKLQRDAVAAQIARVIRRSYVFMGYIEFANYVDKIAGKGDPEVQDDRVRGVFDGTLVVVDEVHNIRTSIDNASAGAKRAGRAVRRVADTTDDMRLLLLSATPMFNSATEIAWVLGLLAINDGRVPVPSSDMFDESGDLREDGGHDALQRASNGYVSFVRGEDPFTFPIRIWPSSFAPDRTFEAAPRAIEGVFGGDVKGGPGGPVVRELYLTDLPPAQLAGYALVVSRMIAAKPGLAGGQGASYTDLQRPLEALNMIYPPTVGETYEDYTAAELVGKGGLERIVKIRKRGELRGDAEYVDSSGEHVFARENIGKYSAKISAIADAIEATVSGVVLVYSQYIDGGLVPLALALEERGFTQPRGRTLFAAPPGSAGQGRVYALITGDRSLSVNNAQTVSLASSPANVAGDVVKVVLVSQAGSEGLDFKHIRQVHIMEPWYNMSRVEQVIGRAVRNCSLDAVPFASRNVQLFLHASLVGEGDREAADVYVYGLAERKAQRAGAVTRTLKQMAVDCPLTREQRDMAIDKLNERTELTLATGETIDWDLGDRDGSAVCDYQACESAPSCIPNVTVSSKDVSLQTYSVPFLMRNSAGVLARVLAVFREVFAVRYDDLVARINASRQFSQAEVDGALSRLVLGRGVPVTDPLGRPGRVVNIGDLYVFQPIELTSRRASMFARSSPIAFKPTSVPLPVVSAETGPRSAELKEPGILEALGRVMAGDDVQWTEPWLVGWSMLATRPREVLRAVGADKADLLAALSDRVMSTLDQRELLAFLNSKAPLADERKSFVLKHALRDPGATLEGIMALAGDRPALVVRESAKAGTWREGTSEDMFELRSALEDRAIPVAPWVGMLVPRKAGGFVFKVKDTSRERNRGARCDQTSRRAAVDRLASMLTSTDTPYDPTEFATVTRPQTKGDTANILSSNEICALQELVLMLAEERDKKKRWYAGPALALELRLG